MPRSETKSPKQTMPVRPRLGGLLQPVELEPELVKPCFLAPPAPSKQLGKELQLFGALPLEPVVSAPIWQRGALPKAPCLPCSLGYNIHPRRSSPAPAVAHRLHGAGVHQLLEFIHVLLKTARSGRQDAAVIGQQPVI